MIFLLPYCWISGSEKRVFIPDTAGTDPCNAAKDIVIVLNKRPIDTNDTFVSEGSKLAVKDFPFADHTAFLVRIGHANPPFETPPNAQSE